MLWLYCQNLVTSNRNVFLIGNISFCGEIKILTDMSHVSILFFEIYLNFITYLYKIINKQIKKISDNKIQIKLHEV